MLHEVTDDAFQAEVVESDVPCVIEFTAGWCTMCDSMAPAFEELSEQYGGKLKFCIVNIEQSKRLYVRFAVAAVPYIVLVHDGKQTPLFDELVGVDLLRERIDYVLGGNPAPTTRPL